MFVDHKWHFKTNTLDSSHVTHHLCKHLVQAVPTPPVKFWGTIIRRRVVPIYRHTALVQKGMDGEVASSDGFVDLDDGTITEGDDHVWLGNPDVLRGGGGWRDLDAVQLLGKRTRGAAVALGMDDDDSDNNGEGSRQRTRDYHEGDSDDDDEVR
jgi:hypothetical protein